MHWPILIAALHFLSPSIINAKKINEDDNWDDPFYVDRKLDTVGSDWMDPFDLEGYRNWQQTVMETEKDIEALPKERKNDGVVANVEIRPTTKVSQISGKMEVAMGFGEGAETESEAVFHGTSENLKKEEISQFANKEMEHNFLQRFVNLLVNTCSSKNAEKQQKISVTMEISQDALKELRRLKEKNDTAPVIRLLNIIISDMKVYDHNENDSSFLQSLLHLVSSKEVWMEIGVISFAVLPIILFMLGRRIIKILCLTILTTFSVSYYGTYRYMLLEVKEKNKRILSSTVACTPDEKSWYNTVFWSNSDNECQKRWNAMYIDPSIEVTPLKVISHMVGVAVFQPMEQFGIMFSSFSNQIFESQPLMRGIIVYTAAVLIIICVIFFCCYGIFGSQYYQHTLTGHPYDGNEPPNSSLHPKCKKQVFGATINNQVPGFSYEALPHQPLYIITNYRGNIPKSAVTKNIRAKKQKLQRKGETSSSKQKSEKGMAKHEINSVPSDETETTDDENEPLTLKNTTHKDTRSDVFTKIQRC